MVNNYTFIFSKWGYSLVCVLAAFIWGIAFVAQSTGGDLLGPYTFNCIRWFLGGIVLIPITLITNSFKHTKEETSTHTQKANKKLLFLGGILCGLLLCIASNLQQIALTMGAPAGKAGFLTACYILLVPVFGLFLKKACGLHIWFSVVIAVAGLYLLCINGSFSLQQTDILLLICAVVFALHILVVDHFAPKVNCIALSCIQFFVCGIVTAIPMFFVDMSHSMNGVVNTLSPLNSINPWIPLLYTGILSSGVAYTLQIVGQKHTSPTVASLLFSLESVFSVLAGWALLNQQLQTKELMGCLLIFGAILLSQISLEKKVSS